MRQSPGAMLPWQRVGEVVEQVRRAVELAGRTAVCGQPTDVSRQDFCPDRDRLAVPIGTVLTRMRLALEKTPRELEGKT